jgi:O-antigen/teichoic acid export membrane protein
MIRPLALVSACTAATHACTLASMLMLVRALGPDRYGVFVTGLAVQAYLALLGSLGVKQVVAREGSICAADLARLCTAHLAVTGSASLLLAVIVISATACSSLEPAERHLLVLLAAGNVAVCVGPQPLFDACLRQPLSSALTLLVDFVALAGVTTAYVLGRLDLESAGALLAGKWTCNCLLHYLVLWRMRLLLSPCCPSRERQGLRGDVAALVRRGWPLLGAALLATIPINAGVLFVRHYDGEASAGLLGLGTQAATAFAFIAAVAARILVPPLARPFSSPAAQQWRVLRLYAGFLGIVLVAALGGGWGALTFLFPPAFAGALAPMFMLLGAAFVFGLGTPSAIALAAASEERWVMLASGVGAIAYLPGCALLVPGAGTLGAAAATSMAALCTTTLLALRWRASWAANTARSVSENWPALPEDLP